MQPWEAAQVRTLGWALLAFGFVWALLDVGLRATSAFVLEDEGQNVTIFGLEYFDAIRLYSYLAVGFAVIGVAAIGWAVAMERRAGDDRTGGDEE